MEVAAVQANGSPGESKVVETVMRILKGAVKAGASDIHLHVGRPPTVRLEGDICPLDHPPLSANEVDTAKTVLASYAKFDFRRLEARQGDFACEVSGVDRFRVHFYRQNNSSALAIRIVPRSIPDFASLRVPPIVKRIAELESGLVLVTGATGNGKSTTVASMLNLVNQERAKHIVTIEDPIEFVFDEKRARFSLRQIGRDVDSVQAGLVGALREDPDIIFVGEIRTLEEFDVALGAAEAGHVVLSTLHSKDTSRAVERMIHFYPQEHQQSARERIAEALQAVISQRLVKRRASRELVLTTEILRRTPTVQDCIRDHNRFRGLTQALAAGNSEYGTHTFDQQLLRYVRDQVISPETARAAASNPNDLVRAIKMGAR